jgi:hypothetical protein
MEPVPVAILAGIASNAILIPSHSSLYAPIEWSLMFLEKRCLFSGKTFHV